MVNRLACSSFTIFNQNILLKSVGSVKIIKALAGFELMTCRFVVNSLIHCAILLDNTL